MKLLNVLTLVKCKKCTSLQNYRSNDKIETYYNCTCFNNYGFYIHSDLDENINYICFQLKSKIYINPAYNNYREFYFDPLADPNIYEILLSEEAFLKLIENFDIERINEKYDTLMLFK